MQHDNEITSLVERIAKTVGGAGLTLACAESLTAGQIATALGAGESSGEWFMGGVVAYHRETKYRILGVDRGPVVCESAALQMARGVADATGADIAVSVTGVGGPDMQDDMPVGTVYMGVHTPDSNTVESFTFVGEPVDIVRQTTVQALRTLADAVESRS